MKTAYLIHVPNTSIVPWKQNCQRHHTAVDYPHLYLRLCTIWKSYAYIITEIPAMLQQNICNEKCNVSSYIFQHPWHHTASSRYASSHNGHTMDTRVFT